MKKQKFALYFFKKASNLFRNGLNLIKCSQILYVDNISCLPVEEGRVGFSPCCVPKCPWANTSFLYSL